MRDVKLTIDGKEVQLTNEQLKALGITKEKNNPFERVNKGTFYYYGKANGTTEDFTEADDSTDTGLYNAANYFNDKQFAEQVTLHQLLYRKLLKYAYNSGFEDTVWNNLNEHWYIFYNYANGCFGYRRNDICKSQNVYFSSEEAAEQAIKEVVEPFVKEHPEFVW